MKTVATLFKSGDYRTISAQLLRVAGLKKMPNADRKSEPKSHRALAEHLIGSAERKVSTIVDYGCGPAYVSLEIAQLYKDKRLAVPMTYLLDIDCLMKDFALHRFKKRGFPVASISVTENDLYPKVPVHDICIVSEVMEHVKDPLKVFGNINAGLRPGGVLHGNYDDHTPHALHVSPDLKNLRSQLDAHKYHPVSRHTYRKGQI